MRILFEPSGHLFCCSYMRKKILGVLSIVCCVYSYAQSGKAVVEIENIQVTKGGAVSAAVFSKSNFLKTGKELATVAKKVSSTKMVFVFENLPAGDYAFVAYHDIDGNKSMKTNIIGYPKEPFGISNNPKILFGPPSFNESKVKVVANKATAVRISLN